MQTLRKDKLGSPSATTALTGYGGASRGPCAVGWKLLNAAVSLVGYVDRSSTIQIDRKRRVQLIRPGAITIAPGYDRARRTRRTVGRKLLNPVVTRVGYVDCSATIHIDRAR